MTTPQTLRLPPTVAQVRDWVQVSATSLSEEAMQIALLAEQQLQADQCEKPPDPSGQGLIPHWAYQALLRRMARECAARGLPLGMNSDTEGGPSRLASYDGEIARLEGPYRIMAHG